MSGILEQILADVQQIKTFLANGSAQPVAVQQTQPVVQPQQQPQPVDPFGMGAPAAVQPPQVTEAQVMALIEPHLDNAAIKTALQGVLGQMGIARLPDARPDQYAELFQKFNAVIQQFQAQPAQPQSII